MTISFIYVDELIFYSDHLVEHIRYVVCVRLCVRVFVSGGVDGCAVPPLAPWSSATRRGGGVAGRHMGEWAIDAGRVARVSFACHSATPLSRVPAMTYRVLTTGPVCRLIICIIL